MAYQWQCVKEQAAFPGRDGAGALVYKDAMWLMGGWSKQERDAAYYPRICSNDVWRSTDGADWTCVKPNTFLDDTFDARTDWEGRHTAGYVVHQGRMWIVGGDCNQGYYQPDVWWSTDGVAWTCATHEAPWGYRCLHHTAVFNGLIWVIAGQTMPTFVEGGDEDVFHRDIWVSEDGANWREVTPKEPYWPQRAMIGGFAVHQSRLWILGGGTYDTVRRPTRLFYNDVWSTANGVDWTCHTDAAPWAPRQYHDVGVWDGKLWVMEGYNREEGGNRNDVWYSPDGETWTEVPETPWAPRHAASVFVYDDALWMVAGNNMEPDAWKLVRV